MNDWSAAHRTNHERATRVPTVMANRDGTNVVAEPMAQPSKHEARIVILRPDVVKRAEENHGK